MLGARLMKNIKKRPLTNPSIKEMASKTINSPKLQTAYRVMRKFHFFLQINFNALH